MYILFKSYSQIYHEFYYKLKNYIFLIYTYSFIILILYILIDLHRKF